MRFSVITICWNEVDTIRATCESICAQGYRDFQWVVVDGASSDGTLEVLQEYAGHIDVLVSEPDDGIYNAMNKGVALAEGEYLIFMNGGDRFVDGGVLADVAACPDKDILYGDLQFDWDRRDVTRYPDTLPPNYLLWNMLPHQGAFFRRRLFQDHGLHDESYRIAGDYEIFVRFLHVHGVSYHHIARVIAVFDGNGISKDPVHRMLRKEENHRIRKATFPAYRWSFKAIKQEVRSRFRRLG